MYKETTETKYAKYIARIEQRLVKSKSGFLVGDSVSFIQIMTFIRQ